MSSPTHIHHFECKDTNKPYNCQLFSKKSVLLSHKKQKSMRKRAQNSNRQFLVGTAAMAFAVGAVVVIFLLLSFRQAGQLASVQASEDIYQIEFAKGFAGDSAIVYLNDSLVWYDVVPTDTARVCIRRFADENTLMVSRSREDAVSIFAVGEKAGRLILRKTDGIVSMTTVGW